MQAFVITLQDDENSVSAADKLIKSSEKHENDFVVEKFDAVTPDQVSDMMSQKKLKWNWPWKTLEMDMQSGITKQPYLTANRNKRIACFLSHYLLWEKCAALNESIIVFEHDALINRKIRIDLLEAFMQYTVIGLNDPRRATRKSDIYHQKVQEQNGFVVNCPKIDFDQIAQGLAGNSAYYLKPDGARKLIDLVNYYGAWPNDAIMCRQLMPRVLGQCKQYLTSLQSMESTTKL